MNKPNILLIYTGGTIGMIEDPNTKALIPFNFENIVEQVPELKKIEANIASVSFEEPMDSSNMKIDSWKKIVGIIEENYLEYDGFVVLHGSDTMSYTASALSFMLRKLGKPVILTGSQLPIETIRTDGKDNLITAIEVAAKQFKGKPMVPEVCIYFENCLYRGNRTSKINSEDFEAFNSYNYPKLAEAGVLIKFNRRYIHYRDIGTMELFTELESNVAILKLFPGIQENVVRAVLEIKELKGLVLETFGSGNAPTYTWLIDLLKKTTGRGVFVLNVTQCMAGSVIQGMYDTSSLLDEIGVISGRDITTEAAVTKMMYVLGKYKNPKEVRIKLATSLAGEMS